MEWAYERLGERQIETEVLTLARAEYGWMSERLGIRPELRFWALREPGGWHSPYVEYRVLSSPTTGVITGWMDGPEAVNIVAAWPRGMELEPIERRVRHEVWHAFELREGLPLDASGTHGRCSRLAQRMSAHRPSEKFCEFWGGGREYRSGYLYSTFDDLAQLAEARGVRRVAQECQSQMTALEVA